MSRSVSTNDAEGTTGSPSSTRLGPLRLLLVDDHPVLRAGLKSLLSAESDFFVIAAADDGASAVELASRVNPDVVLMDVSLPGVGGAEATRQIKRASPARAVLALSAHEEVSYVRLLLDAGANGYALKRSACEELVRAVRAVCAGNTYVDPSIAIRLLRGGQRGQLRTGAPNTVVLSEREAEVSRFLAQGLTMKEIAMELSLSPRTLETYRARAMEKLGLKSRADLVRYATSRGWLRTA